MNWFEYGGVKSSDLDVRIMSKNVYSAPKYDLTFQEIPGRDGDLISPNGRFPNVSLSYTCFVPAKSIAELSDKITKVKAWLYKEPDRYHTLSDSYDTAFFRKAVFNNKLDISDEVGRIGKFTVTFSCQPFRYSQEGQETIELAGSGASLENPYPFASKPYMKIYGRGTGTLTLQTEDSTESWTFSTLNGYTEVDSELMNFYQDTTLKNDTVEGEGFPQLQPGENTITFDGAITSIEIIPRWRTV